MSNKALLILISCLVVFGLVYFPLQNKEDDSGATKEGVITSIQEAFKSGLSISCPIETHQGNVEVYVRDGGLRYDVTVPQFKGKTQHYLSKDDVTHVWDGGNGYVFRDVSKNTYAKATSLFVTLEDALDSVEEYKNACKIMRLEDALFVAPSDVTFVEVKTTADAEALEEQKMQKDTPEKGVVKD